MESSESINTVGKMKSENDLMENHSTSSSEKQLSLFSLTLDKIQSKSGRSIGSMNIDEFLNSVWTTCDEFQASNEDPTGKKKGIEQTTFLRQRSLSVPTPFSGKTVDEVWAEIQQRQNNNVVHAQQNHPRASATSNEAASLGEMTLEEFLVKTGVIKEVLPPPNLLPSQQAGRGMLENLNSNPNSGSFFSRGTGLDMNISIGQMMGYELMSNTPSNRVENGNALISKGSSSVYHMFMEEPPSAKIGNEKRNGPSNGAAGETNGKTRTASASMEAAIERRQRRMIKNRESAQRSRARKQAYTAELEIELKRVRDEYESLKHAVEEADKHKHEGCVHGWPTKKKFKTLRRTISSSW